MRTRNASGLSTVATSTRSQRSHASCTTSSASPTLPSSRYATPTSIGRWATGSAETVFACRFYFYYTVATTADLEWLEIRAANDSTYLLRVRNQGTNRLRLVDSAGTTIWTSTAALTAATWYVASVVGNTGTTTANGTAQIAYRALGDAGWIEAPSAFTGNYGAGSLAGNARLGKTQRLSALHVAEELPRSAIGKVLKRELRDRLAQTA